MLASDDGSVFEVRSVDDGDFGRDGEGINNALYPDHRPIRYSV